MPYAAPEAQLFSSHFFTHPTDLFGLHRIRLEPGKDRRIQRRVNSSHSRTDILALKKNGNAKEELYEGGITLRKWIKQRSMNVARLFKKGDESSPKKIGFRLREKRKTTLEEDLQKGY
jgi:hypothetical protein